MKKQLMIAGTMLMLASCAKMRSVETHVLEQSYGQACPKPEYVATIWRDADIRGGAYVSTSLRFANLVKEAQEKYGKDVTIQNVRWDLQNGKRRSVVYDVIKCK